MTEKKKRERAAIVVEKLKQRYPDAACALEYGGDPWRLLVMGRLSAQCTDARVNVVCKDLFAAYPDVYAMARAEYADVERLVFSCGVYKVKAANIIDFSKIITEDFGGKVPDNMEDLLKLPGVGRKIANLILGDIYHKPAIVADTHCIRISNRWELCDSDNPVKVERALSAIVPGEEQSDLCHRIVLFGRDICSARSPKCAECPFAEFKCKVK